MKFSEIAAAKERVAILKAEAARLEKEIRRAELNAEMNRIEAEDGRIVVTINLMKSMFSENDENAAHVINTLKKRSSELNAEWQEVYKEYYYL